MAFNSFGFLVFLATTIAVHFVLPRRWRWLLLLVASLYFYSQFQLRFVLLLGASTGAAYVAGLSIALGRAPIAHAAAWLGVAMQVAVLAVYKYADFLLGSVEAGFAGLGLALLPAPLPRLDLILPAGLSFYIFSAISYLIDVRRGTIPAELNPLRLALYISFFPKLIAGPIERAGAFLGQLAAPAPFSPALFVAGLQLVLLGLVKKVVIADRLAEFVNAGYANPALQSPVTLLVAVYLYPFQIYCDFSGYSDIAIGAAALFGVRLMQNFCRPYLATSVVEFWGRRWHISLMAWFRDYLYIPMGGNRVSALRRHLNVMAVFLVSGLWHGAAWTFVAWGALNGAYQVLHAASGGARARLAKVLPGPLWLALSGILTFHLILVTWIFFRAETIAKAWTVLTRIVDAIPQYPALFATYVWPAELRLACALVVVLVMLEAWDEMRGFWRWLDARPTALRWSFHLVALAALLILGKWGAGQFVYAQF